MKQPRSAPKGITRFFRTMQVEGIAQEDGLVRLSFVSEEPVRRNFSSGQGAGGWFVEVLECLPGSVDLSRLNSGGALLVEHDRSDQIGCIQKAWIDATRRRGEAIVRFGNGPRAQEILRDVLDGIRSLVSVSYEANIKDAEHLGESEDGLPIFRIRKWLPVEISIVSVPADATVGVGRSHSTTIQTMSNQPPAHPARSLNPGQGHEPPGAMTPRAVAAAMQNLWKQHRCEEIDPEGEILGQFIADSRYNLQDVQDWILKNRFNAKPANLDPRIGMSTGEVKRYSVVRALSLFANNKPLDGLELEASNTVAKRTGRPATGFYIPHDVAVRSLAEAHGLSTGEVMSMMGNIRAMEQARALTAGSASAGGYTVGTNVLGGSLIELLRNKTMVLALGATNLTGLIGDVAIPRHTGGATAYWLDETSDVTDSQQTFGQLALTPHRLSASTPYSKQLLVQSSIDVEAFVRGDLMRVLAIEKDRAALNGLNAAGEPLGLLNTNGIGSVTFGAAATWAKVLDFETQVATANADMGALAYLTTPAVRAKWKAAVKIAASQYSDFLWEKGSAPGSGVVNTYRAEATNQVPSAKVIFGNWADLIIADWDGLDVVVDPYSLAKRAHVQVTIHTLTDNGMRHVGSFCVSSDSGAQ